MTPGGRFSPAEVALVSTIYSPPRARRRWVVNDVLPDGVQRLYSLARWGLVDALRAYGVGPGDRVLVPGLICREVLASINVVGAVPVFYPVTSHLSPALDDSGMVPAKAVLAVNYFGFPQDLEVFRAYCRRTGAALIEDNAHGLFSRDHDGRLLGSRGDAGLFSFRKTIPVPDGSALVLSGGREPPGDTSHLAPAPGPRYRLKQAFRRLAAVAGPATTSRIIGGVRQLRRATTGHAIAPGPVDAEMLIPGLSDPTMTIRRPIAAADPDEEVRRRRALYQIAAEIAERSGAALVFPVLPANVVPYGLPVYVPPDRAVAIREEVNRRGLQLAVWPDLPAKVAPDAPDHYRQLMVLPFLW